MSSGNFGNDIHLRIFPFFADFFPFLRTFFKKIEKNSKIKNNSKFSPFYGLSYLFTDFFLFADPPLFLANFPLRIFPFFCGLFPFFAGFPFFADFLFIHEHFANFFIFLRTFFGNIFCAYFLRTLLQERTLNLQKLPKKFFYFIFSIF